MRLIDADALMKDIRENSASYFADDFAHEWVDKQPTVDAQPVRHGKWVINKYGDLCCSECNWCAPVIETGCLVSRRKEYDRSEYCWHCGAKMDG